MSGKSTSVSFSFDTSTPFLASDALAVSSATFFSVFTASVLPSRSFGERIGLSPFTMIAEKSFVGSVWTKVPGATTLSGMFLLFASSTETRFEPPMSTLPETTAGTTVAPPWLGFTCTVSLRFLK
jgi:hypothetical protein